MNRPLYGCGTGKGENQSIVALCLGPNTGQSNAFNAPGSAFTAAADERLDQLQPVMLRSCVTNP